MAQLLYFGNPAAVALVAVLVVAVLAVALYAAFGEKKKRRSGFCGSSPNPMAVAEANGLAETGWRPDLRTGAGGAPSCGGPLGPAVAEAQGLQQAGALAHGSPYYTPSGAPPSGLITRFGDADEFAVRRLQRETAATSARKARARTNQGTGSHVSARKARMTSMREGLSGMSEGFGGPDTGGFGWVSEDAPPARAPARECVHQCLDSCTGSGCVTHCGEQCSP